MADKHDTPSRRALLAGGAALLPVLDAAAVPVTTGSTTEATLNRLSEEYVALEDAWRELCEAEDAATGEAKTSLQARLEANSAAREAIEAQVRDTPATSLAGLGAKARMIQADAGYSTEGEFLQLDEDLAWDLVQDVLALTRGAA